ncbi:MFS transporter [Pseudonocardia acaciae]|uniref:MFS transporter n=1 Tax=Pseudonocardia acaciae TaxID=551276 RepID=UPI000490BE81|nr:MFS transporter [Pseudonocardia acaciae]
MSLSPAGAGTWAELRARYLGISSVISGGVLMVALNIYVVASLLPTAIAEIGGEELYAWSTSLYVVTMVIGSTLVSACRARWGGAGAYRIALGGFALGSVICGLAPVMPVLLVGRVLQGFGGGLLHGLAFVMVQRALPERLWSRGMVLISSMFAAGNFVGPGVGGVFAQFTSWRYAFAVLTLAAVLIAFAVGRAVPGGDRSRAAAPVPATSVLVAAVTAAISVAGIVPPGWPMTALLLGGIVLLAAFLAAERRARARILSTLVFVAHNPLKWLYLTTATLAFAIGTESFLPLFGQRLGGMPPVIAGFFGAALALGWTLVQLFTGSARRLGVIRLLKLFGPMVLAVGLALFGLLLRDAPPTWLMIVWVATLLIAGSGIAMAMPHLGAATMAVTSDPDEATKASAGIATVLNIGNAFGAAFAGVLVNLGAPSTLASARYLFLTFALVCALGTVTAALAGRDPAPRPNTGKVHGE